MKKLLSTVAAIFCTSAIAYAAYLPPVTGPQDPSQINAVVNNALVEVNSGVNGLVVVVPGVVSSTGTTAEQTLATVSVPASQIAVSGQALRLRCSGYMANTTHSGTSAKLYYGTSSIATGNATTAGQSFDLNLLVTYNASATSGSYVGTGLVGTTVVTPTATTNLTDAMNTSLTAKCTTTQGTASAADVQLVNFSVEQVK